jgi:hypothetical protein
MSANHESYFTVFRGSPLNEVERECIRRTIDLADVNKARASEFFGRAPSDSLRKNSSATTLDTNRTVDPIGTDTARRAMVETA